MRPTRRGLGVLGGSVVAIVLGWLFGLPEASALGAAGATLVAATAGLVWFRGAGPEVRRIVRPERLTVGERCQVLLVAENRGRRQSPLTRLTDDVGHDGVANILLAPMTQGEHAEASYSLSTDRRGVRQVGPLRRRVGGPFGFWRLVTTATEPRHVMIVPRPVPLSPLPAAAGDEPELGVRSMVSFSTVEEEFTGLRNYVTGDDVRRIHWPSSARSGGAVVRQFEVPWQHRTTVVMDLRASRHDPASFERAVTVVASLVELSARGGELIRFCTTSDIDPPFLSASLNRDALLDRLATIGPVDEPADSERLTRAVESVGRTAIGRLVICTGVLRPDEAQGLLGAASRAGLAVLVTTGSSHAGAAGRRWSDARHVHWSGQEDLALVWAAAATGAGAPRQGVAR